MKISQDGRYFVNTSPSFHEEVSQIVELPQKGEVKFTENFQKNLASGAERLLSLFEQRIEEETDWSDNSVYTGSAGYALLYYFLSRRRSGTEIEQARSYVERALELCRGKQLTFITGDAGPLAIGAAVYSSLDNPEKTTDLLQKLKDLAESHQVDNIQTKLPDEALYGRVGYLYALLFVREEVGESTIEDEHLKRVAIAVLASGEHLAKKHPKFGSPLMYQWHDSYYLGGAHGISGILLYLLKVRHLLSESDLEKIKGTLDFLLGVRYPSGNLPSSIGSKSDKLVQWCHGSPGFTALLIEAAKVFGAPEYTDAAEQSCDVIWERGLLTKGYGICHGAAGNAYSFLQLYQATKDPKQLHRAGVFAEFCLNYGAHGCGDPDRPLSLFEGLAGTVYFLFDLFDPLQARFPGF